VYLYRYAIFNVKYWRDLEILAMVRPRSIKMAPISRSYDLLLYWSVYSVIVTIALSFTVFELFDVK